MGKTRVRVGDIIEIPLSDGRKAYGQYVYRDVNQGPLVQIFDLFTRGEIQLNDLRNAKPLFPPIITGIFAAVRTGLWKVIGRLPIENFIYPKFVSAFYNEKTGEAYLWYLWDGEKSIKIGRELPDEYKNLEYLVGSAPQDVAKRIETGENYPYDQLIKRNRFDVRKEQEK